MMTIEQLQKPNVAAKLVTKFALTLPVSDRALNRVPAAGRRGRLGDGGFMTSGAVDPRGLTVTKADELVLANAGDESVLLYDLEGRLVRRIDQCHLLQSRVQRDNEQSDEAARAAAADRLDNKLVSSCFSLFAVSVFQYVASCLVNLPSSLHKICLNHISLLSLIIVRILRRREYASLDFENSFCLFNTLMFQLK